MGRHLYLNQSSHLRENDLRVLHHFANSAPSMSPSTSLPESLKTGERPTLTGIWLKAIRWRQWIKNILVFLPLMFAHEAGNPQLLARCFLAFLAFCSAASAIYLINDVLDAKADRMHATKSSRPIAAGWIHPRTALIASGSLMAVSLLLGSLLSWYFLVVCVLYIGMAVLYSLRLKRIAILDVLLLAGFYTVRIFAGSVATLTPVSDWLLLVSMFFFLSLALQKRLCELRESKESDQPLQRRGYLKADQALIQQMGVSSGYLAVLVFALYIQSPTVTAHYANPGVLWWACPCLLYWMSRLWLLATRGEVTEDAINFAFRDKISYVVGATVVLIMLLARPV
jgi:4-hydroxybenzoate polyprenyltransferase